jgi:hypothetical protein
MSFVFQNDGLTDQQYAHVSPWFPALGAYKDDVRQNMQWVVDADRDAYVVMVNSGMMGQMPMVIGLLWQGWGFWIEAFDDFTNDHDGDLSYGAHVIWDLVRFHATAQSPFTHDEVENVVKEALVAHGVGGMAEDGIECLGVSFSRIGRWGW